MTTTDKQFTQDDIRRVASVAYLIASSQQAQLILDDVINETESAAERVGIDPVKLAAFFNEIDSARNIIEGAVEVLGETVADITTEG